MFGRKNARIAELEKANAALRNDKEGLKRTLATEKERRSNLSGSLVREIDRSNKLSGRLMVAHRALRDIKGMVTPHAAYAARKMAARADEALPAELGGHPKGDGGSGCIQTKPANGAAVLGVSTAV